MPEIKTDGNVSERSTKIERHAFDALPITRATWRNVGNPSEIQWPRLNRNNSHLSISSKPLIED